MGNTPLSSPDMDSGYGRTTEQIDGVLTLKKSQATSTKSAKQRLRGLVPSWHSSRSKNKGVKSLLMRSILARDWQKVLIRARLFPCEVHEFAILEVPLSIARERESNKTIIEYCRVKVLPVHAACALRPPPEVVRALLSHAVGAAMGTSSSISISSSSGSMEKSFASKSAYAYARHQQLSCPVPLHHEDNTSFAAVGVQRLEELSIGKTIAHNGKAIANKLSLLAAARRASFCEKKGAKLRLLCSTTEEEDERDEEGIGEDSPNRRENAKEVDLFLKQMEDHLAHNGRCRSVFRDATPETKSCSPRSVFVLDFDPLVLLPSPSAVRMMEKQTRAIHPDNNGGADLFSLENSIGDSDTAMTTSTPQLVGIHAKSGGKNGEESSSLEYLTDDSSSASSSLLEPPSNLCDDSDDHSNGSNSFLQLTADGNLEIVDLEDDSGSEDSSDDDPNLVFTSNSSESSGSNASVSSNTNCQSSSGLPSSRSFSDKFVPDDIRLNPSSLFRSLPPASSRKRGHVKSKNNKELLSKQGHGENSQSRLLPLHIACLYGASAAILKILLEEYPEGSSIEVLGMLPIHMVAANWSLAAAEELQSRHESGHNYSMEESNAQQDRLAQLVECSPKTLWANSVAHGLRPLEYTRILLCYPANVSDKGLVAAKIYLDSQERRHDRGTSNHLQETAKPLTNDKVDIYCNHPIEATSTCTTSGISSAWMANDSSSAHSSSVSNSHSSSAQSSSASNSHSSSAYSSSASKCTPKARQVSLVGLLCQSRWEEAMSLLKTNPETAKERCFSNSNSNTNTSFSTLSTSSSSGLKEILPIHMACQILKKGSSIPIYLVQSLVLAHPEGLKETDDDAMSGSLPLHLICDSFRRRHTTPNGWRVGGSGEEHRAFVSERLQVLKIVLTAHPEATHIRDNRGRMPLHTAVLARAPVEAIRLLVHRDPQVVSLPDKDGSSPFYLATKMYACDSPVMILLKQAWI